MQIITLSSFYTVFSYSFKSAFNCICNPFYLTNICRSETGYSTRKWLDFILRKLIGWWSHHFWSRWLERRLKNTWWHPTAETEIALRYKPTFFCQMFTVVPFTARLEHLLWVDFTLTFKTLLHYNTITQYNQWHLALIVCLNALYKYLY